VGSEFAYHSQTLAVPERRERGSLYRFPWGLFYYPLLLLFFFLLSVSCKWVDSRKKGDDLNEYFGERGTIIPWFNMFSFILAFHPQIGTNKKK